MVLEAFFNQVQAFLALEGGIDLKGVKTGLRRFLTEQGGLGFEQFARGRIIRTKDFFKISMNRQIVINHKDAMPGREMRKPIPVSVLRIWVIFVHAFSQVKADFSDGFSAATTARASAAFNSPSLTGLEM